MKIKLDEYDKVSFLISGLFQFEENALFSQAALAITEYEIFIYDDHRPTDKNEGVYHYAVKKRFKIRDIDLVIDEKITGNADLSNYGRLYFYREDDEDSFEFYYMQNDKKELYKLLKELNKLGVPNTKKTTKIKATKF